MEREYDAWTCLPTFVSYFTLVLISSSDHFSLTEIVYRAGGEGGEGGG